MITNQEEYHANLNCNCCNDPFVGGTALAFLDNGDGTIKDSRTNLVWQKQDDGTTRRWEDAVTYCEGLSLGGQTDWRLPNIKELKTIVYNTKYNPAIDTTYFPNTHATIYWSSTYIYTSNGSAQEVHFYYGDVTGAPLSNNYYVRCVRGGQ